MWPWPHFKAAGVSFGRLLELLLLLFWVPSEVCCCVVGWSFASTVLVLVHAVGLITDVVDDALELGDDF